MTARRAFYDQVITDPKRMFPIDSLGAWLTVGCLLAILYLFDDQFGMPRPTLSVLAGIACVCGVYSLSCYRFVTQNRRPFLRAMATANTLYWLLTAILMVIHVDRLTTLGLLYFGLEIVIIGVLVFVETKAAQLINE